MLHLYNHFAFVHAVETNVKSFHSVSSNVVSYCLRGLVSLGVRGPYRMAKYSERSNNTVGNYILTSK